MTVYLKANKDPITAGTKLYWGPARSYLANSGSVQPYQSSFRFNYVPINMGGNDMLSCCCNYNVPTFGIPYFQGARTSFPLFNVTGQMFGNYGGCGNSYGLFNIGNYGGGAYSYPMFGEGILGGLIPFGSGSVSGGGVASSWGRGTAASASPWGSSVISANPWGKSKSINLGPLGSIAKGSGGRAWNIAGLVSHTRANGNSSWDFSNLIGAALNGYI